MPILPGEVAVADDVADGPGVYVPTLTSNGTNPTLGTGSVQLGWYARAGRLVTFGAVIRFGTSGVAAGSGAYLVDLPFPAARRCRGGSPQRS